MMISAVSTSRNKVICMCNRLTSVWSKNPESHAVKSGPEAIKLFSCSTQLSMKI